MGGRRACVGVDSSIAILDVCPDSIFRHGLVRGSIWHFCIPDGSTTLLGISNSWFDNQISFKKRNKSNFDFFKIIDFIRSNCCLPICYSSYYTEVYHFIDLFEWIYSTHFYYLNKCCFIWELCVKWDALRSVYLLNG